MDSYIVRVYRRGKGDSTSMVGTVNSMATHEQRSFKNADELWRILRSDTAVADAGGARTRPDCEYARPPRKARKEKS